MLCICVRQPLRPSANGSAPYVRQQASLSANSPANSASIIPTSVFGKRPEHLHAAKCFHNSPPRYTSVSTICLAAHASNPSVLLLVLPSDVPALPLRQFPNCLAVNSKRYWMSLKPSSHSTAVEVDCDERAGSRAHWKNVCPAHGWDTGKSTKQQPKSALIIPKN